MHFVTMAHQLAWMEHPAIWLCAVLRNPVARVACGSISLGSDRRSANALRTGDECPGNGHQCRVDARGRNAIHSASSEPDVAGCDVCKRGCHYWQTKHGSDCLASATSLCSAGVF